MDDLDAASVKLDVAKRGSCLARPCTSLSVKERVGEGESRHSWARNRGWVAGRVSEGWASERAREKDRLGKRGAAWQETSGRERDRISG